MRRIENTEPQSSGHHVSNGAGLTPMDDLPDGRVITVNPKSVLVETKGRDKFGNPTRVGRAANQEA